MQYYVNIEAVDFYWRINFRYSAQLVLKNLWKDKRSRAGFVQAATGPVFERFLMMMINDTTFLLDEARTALEKIRELETGDRDGDDFRRAEGQLKTYLQLADEQLNLFVNTSAEAAAPFHADAIVTQLARMLNFNLVAVVDPAVSVRYEVADPASYNYNPRLLLSQIVSIYINVSRGSAIGRSDFLAAVVGDGRSFNLQMMRNAAVILQVDFVILLMAVVSDLFVFTWVAVLSEASLTTARPS